MPEIEAPELTAGADEVQPTADAPATPEGAAPSAPADEAAITEPAAGLSTRSRGPDGRFIKADGTQASEAEHAAIEAAAPSSPPLAATTPQPPATPSAAPGEPFVFRADGQKIPVPGSSVSPDGALTIPADQVPAIRQLLAEGVSHRGSWRTKEQEYKKQIETAGATERAEAEKWFALTQRLYTALTDAESITALASDPREIQYFKRELQLAFEAANLKAPRPVEAPAQDPAVEQQQLESAAQSVLQEVVEELMESPQAKAIYATAEDRAEATKWYLRHLATYADEQDGQWVIDTHLVKQDFDDHLKIRQAARTAALNATKAHEFNAKRNVAPVAPPPVVSTKGPGGNGAGNRPQFKTREEYNKAMGIN